MKTFCKIICGLLVAVMLLSAAVACAGSGETPKTEETAAATQAGTATPDAQTTKDPAQATESKPADGTQPVDVTTGDETPEPQGLVKPEINEKFGTDSNPKEISFFVNGGEASSLITRSISVEIDLDDAEEVDLTYEPNLKTQQRNDQIKNEIGTKIVVKKIGTMQGSVTDLKPILQSQQPYYDVLALYQYFDLDLALDDTVGSFYNYEKMPEGVTNYLNFSAPYWNKTSYQAMRLSDPETGASVCFFLTGDLTQTNIGNMYVSFVNAKMWDDYKEQIKALETSGGYDDIYDVVNNGYWTLDLWIDLADLCFKDENGNDKPDKDDQLGVFLLNNEDGPDNMSPEILSYGAHVQYTSLDEIGTPVASVNSKNNMNFFSKLYQLYCETKIGTMKYSGEEGENLMDYFSRGNIMVVVNELEKAEEYLLNMQDNYYVMPLPMYSHDQYDSKAASKGYTTGLGDSLTQFAICVYGGDERVPAITATLELMGYYSKLWVYPAYYETALKTRFTRDDRNPAMLDMIHEGIYCNFGFIWSSKLNNITWIIRDNYRNKNGMANLMKQKQNDVKGKLKQLLSSIYTAWFVNY